MNQQKQKSDYIFCFNDTQPRSLIMLGDTQTILELLLVCPDQILFVWIDQKQNKKVAEQMQRIQRQLQIEIFCYKSIGLLTQQKRIQQNLLIICSPQLIEKVKKFAQVKHIIIYPSEEYQESEQSSQLVNYAQNEEDLRGLLIGYKQQNKKHQYKWLPNFISLQNQCQKSEVMAKALWAMINCQSDLPTRKLVVQQLQKLISQLQQLSPDFNAQKAVSRQFLWELCEGELPCQRSIYWYTLESPVFKLINNLLRSTHSPYLLFYVQPYFSSLFKSITLLHKQQKFKRQFFCYRGGRITAQQLERFRHSVGRYIQNLGFLSTSLDEQVSQTYVENVMFTITVDEERELEFSSFGYASISQFSCFFQESEILFNALNYFRLLSIKESTVNGRQFFHIQLQFRGVLLDYQKQSFKSMGLKMDNWLVLNQQDYKNKIKSQGHMLSYQCTNQGGYLYWNKVIQIVEDEKRRITQINLQSLDCERINQKLDGLERLHIEALIEICYVLINRSQLKNSLQFLMKAELLLNQKQKYNELFWAQSLIKIACLYKKVKKYGYSLQLLQKYQKFIIKHHGYFDNLQAQILKTMAQNYLFKGEHQKSIVLLQESAKIKQKVFKSANIYDKEILAGVAEYFRVKGNFSKAIETYTKILFLCKKLYGQEIHYAINLDVLADLYYEKGEFLKALNIIQKALQIKSIFYDNKDHQSVANSLWIAGDILNSLYLTQKALQAYQKSNQILQKFGQQSGYAYVGNLLKIGDIYSLRNQDREAQSFYKKAIKIALQQKNQCQLGFVMSLLCVSNIYVKKKRYDDALDLSLRAQQILREHFQSVTQMHAQTLTFIGSVYLQKQYIYQARSYYQESLNIQRNKYGHINFFSRQNLVLLSNIQLSLHNFTTAKKLLEQAELITRKFYGSDHMKQGEILQKKAQFQYRKGYSGAPLKMQSTSLRIKQRYQAKNSIVLLNGIKKLEQFYFSAGLLKEGLKIYNWLIKLLELQQKMVFNCSLEVLQAINNCVISADKESGRIIFAKSIGIIQKCFSSNKMQKIKDQLKANTLLQISRVTFLDF